jgi:hypothetical protein
VLVIENFNLLAAVLGDTPPRRLRPGQTLVDRESFDFSLGTVTIQPFAYTSGDGTKHNLPIGPRLAAFLRDPVGGAGFDLTLPFRDPRVALSSRSALLRVEAGQSTASRWHTAVDLDVSGDTSAVFDVLAPADGVVEGNAGSSTLALRHAPRPPRR